MKKMVALCCSLMFILSVSMTAFAVTPQEEKQQQVITYENGDCLIIETAVWNEAAPFGVARSSRSSSKTARYQNGAGKEVWTFTLRATFSYNGTTSSVSSCSTSYSIKDRTWSCDDHYAEESGNTAYGYGSFSSSVGSKDVTLSLTCDKNGNIR